jgi:hypothetical protein
VPIFATRAPSDLTLREYVTIVPTLSEAVRRAEASSRPRHPEGLLIDPHPSVEEAHDILERIKAALTRQDNSREAGDVLHSGMTELHAKLALPTWTN